MSKIDLHHGDCRDVLRTLPDASIDSVVTDPPYALVSIVKRFGKPGAAPARGDVYARASAGFMGQQWDTGETAFAVDFWREVFRVLKPGGYVTAFAGTRTYHRLACAVEDAGFEIRDQLAWVYGTGFPKSHDVSKAIDKRLGEQGSFGEPKTDAHRRYVEKGEMRGRHGHDGWQRPWMNDPEAVANAGRVYVPATDAARQWQGWGTALKPAWEPIVLARKPLVGTVAENVLAHGTGALNIEGCRVAPTGESRERVGEASQDRRYTDRGSTNFAATPGMRGGDPAGRWPANIIHDGSEEVRDAFPAAKGQQGRAKTDGTPKGNAIYGAMRNATTMPDPRIDADTSAARFFYSAKASKADRAGSKHPTVKPVALMRYLCRLITPPGGTVLDPFAGSGTTGQAAVEEGFRAILVEREAEYVADIRRRLGLSEMTTDTAYDGVFG